MNTSQIKKRPVHLLELKDQKQMEAWANIVGAMVLNHGQVEFLSILWIQRLSKDPILRDVVIDMQFAKRVEIIKHMVARTDWPTERKQQANNIWKLASELSRERNKVVHNPIVTRPNSDGTCEVGILESKKMKGIGPYALVPISVRDVADTGKSLSHLIGLLHDFFKWMDNQGVKS